MVAFKVKSLLHWRPLPYLLALVVTFSIFGIHMLPSLDSMLNENNTQISHVFLKSQVNYHKELTPFARRPLTTFLIESLSKIFNFKYGYGFILVNFFLLFISGTLLFRLARLLKATLKEALINMLVYFFSFSILFAFFPPVFSYDEPLQYCFVLGALIAFVRQQWFLYVILFTLALITRETSLLLLPGLVLFLPTISEKVVDSSTSNRILLYFKILMPLLFYGLYLLLFMNTYGQFGATKLEIESRYSCFLENFESTRNTVESILSLFFALGPFVYLLVFQKIAYNTKVLKNNWVRAFVLSLILNTPLVILTAFARESRLFALPLLLIWPLFAQLFRKEINLIFSIDAYRQLFRNRKYTLILLIFNLLNFVGCFYYYLKLGLGENNLYAEYLFLINFMIISHFLKYMAKKDLSSRPTLNG